MRPLVHEPMNTLSTAMSVIRVPASGPCSRASASIAARLVVVGDVVGIGTTPVTGTTSSGLVPQVTCGAMSAAVEHDLAS